MQHGLIPIGIFHLFISLVAVVTGLISLVRIKEISARTRLGQIYVITTVLTCVTALAIYQHGGFGRAHLLAIVTLVVMGAGLLASTTAAFGRASKYVATISFSATFLCHLIPAIAEIATRLPLGAPMARSAEEPGVKAVTGIAFLLFAIVAVLQARRLRAQASS